jgi:hypothetical protein
VYLLVLLDNASGAPHCLERSNRIYQIEDLGQSAGRGHDREQPCTGRELPDTRIDPSSVLVFVLAAQHRDVYGVPPRDGADVIPVPRSCERDRRARQLKSPKTYIIALLMAGIAAASRVSFS